MTPPDSGEQCTWIVNGERSGRCVLRSNHAGAHEPDDPRDSGEREVLCPICERPLCRTTLGDSADHEQRARCYRRGFARLQDELAWRADEVRVPLPLAQRILAALETPSIFGSDHRVDLARELRAAVERNSGKECGHLLSRDMGAEWRCGKPVGHEGPHSGTKP